MKKIIAMAAFAIAMTTGSVFAQEKIAYTVVIKYQERLTTTDGGKNVNSRTSDTYTTSVMAYNKKEAEFKANDAKKEFESTCNCRIVSVEVK